MTQVSRIEDRDGVGGHTWRSTGRIGRRSFENRVYMTCHINTADTIPRVVRGTTRPVWSSAVVVVQRVSAAPWFEWAGG